nr:hypothetical protein [Tanacetum cinerariifolium]
FASQVVKNNALIKSVTPHSWPKVICFFSKSHHVSTAGPSKNSSKTMSKTSLKESIGSNDMVYDYYLEEAKKKEQLQKDQALDSKPGVAKPARLPNTTNGSKLKPKNSYQQTRNWLPSMSSQVMDKVVQRVAEQPRHSKSYLNLNTWHVLYARSAFTLQITIAAFCNTSLR